MPFKKGQSGNLEGRKKGTKNKATLIMEAWEAEIGKPAIVARSKLLIDKTMDMALEGDTTCLKIFWDRFLPVSKFEGGKSTQPIVNITITGIEDRVTISGSSPVIEVLGKNTESESENTGT